MPALRTIHFAILLAAAFVLSATASPVPYMDYSDPQLRTTSIAKRSYDVDAQGAGQASLTGPVQRDGEYGYRPAGVALLESLDDIMDDRSDPMGVL